MKNTRLTERELTNIIKRVINETHDSRPEWAIRVEKELYDVIRAIDEGDTKLAKRMIELIVNYMNQNIG
jgi:replication-associated recombination protein RarA